MNWSVRQVDHKAGPWAALVALLCCCMITFQTIPVKLLSVSIFEVEQSEVENRSDAEEEVELEAHFRTLRPRIETQVYWCGCLSSSRNLTTAPIRNVRSVISVNCSAPLALRC